MWVDTRVVDGWESITTPLGDNSIQESEGIFLKSANICDAGGVVHWCLPLDQVGTNRELESRIRVS